MGEEWGAPEPFLFFCDFGGELARGGHRGPAPRVRALRALQRAGAPLPWALHEEGGAVHRGEIDPEGLETLETRTLDGAGWTRRHFALPAPLGPGYHRLILGTDDAPLASATLLRAPRRCFSPAALREGGRTFGIATQLPAVRSARNWGIGDFTDLTRLVELTADQGGGTLVVTPLHALFPGRPGRCNPYNPSSRRFLNLLHIDVERVPELAESAELRALIGDDAFQARLRALRSAPLIDGVSVAQAKREVLERLFRHFRERHLLLGGPRADAFRHWCDAQGQPLTRFARFQALSEHFRDEDGVPLPWTAWPEPYRDPDGGEVAAFAEAHAERVELHRWVQWIARNQVRAVGRRSWELRLAVGLCQDLAVGVAPDGADAWSERGLYLEGVGIGAPPDEFNAAGQDWGVLPWHPQRLREAGYAAFAATLRANMSEAGALRIDHVMGLTRLWWVPEGRDRRDGGYVAYPFEEMLAVLALESSRNQCLVIGEDLGTVPDGLREALDAAGVLSWRLLYFERGADGDFLPPADFEADAAVSVGTHDLPTLAGFWQGTDLEQRRELGLLRTRTTRPPGGPRPRPRLPVPGAGPRRACCPEGTDVDPVSVPELTPALVAAVHRYLARTPSQVLLAQTSDLLGQTEQVNLPGSGDGYPNWRQRQPLELEAWRDDARILEVLEALREERGRLRPAPAGGRGGEQWGRSHHPPRHLPAAAPRRVRLRDAAELVPYLAELGISHCYFSPYLRPGPAAPTATTWWPTTASTRSSAPRRTFASCARSSPSTAWARSSTWCPITSGSWAREPLVARRAGERPGLRLRRLLRHRLGPLKEELRGKVLVPVLGDHYGNLLDRGELN
jgi:(1->4)-alpha-D-glucan 1-alpha-D-glucosylmutase